jgi:hypothetical protein
MAQLLLTVMKARKFGWDSFVHLSEQVRAGLRELHVSPAFVEHQPAIGDGAI